MTTRNMPIVYDTPVGAQFIKINNVVRWIEENPGEFKKIIEEMKLVPPFEKMVLCWKREGLHFRLNVATFQLKDGTESMGFIDHYYPDYKDDILEKTDNDIGWVSQVVQQIGGQEQGEGEDFYVTAYSTTYYDQSGYAYPISTGSVRDEVDIIAEMLDVEIDAFMFNDMLEPLFASCAFMHCRNVEVIDEPLTRQQKRFKKRQAVKGRNVTYFNILDLYPFKKQIVKDGDSISTGVRRAMHMVRGHFATYTDEAPLFGHTTGSIWKPAHVRGHQSEGKIVKDYRIKTEGDDDE